MLDEYLLNAWETRKNGGLLIPKILPQILKQGSDCTYNFFNCCENPP